MQYSEIERVPEDLSETFKKRLDSILAPAISVENIDTYVDDTVNALITLTEDISGVYQQENNSNLSGDTLEDAAFEQYGLPEMGTVLLAAQEKADKIVAIQRRITADSASIKTIITPPDDLGHALRNGEKEFSEKRLLPRLTTLLYLIETDLGLLLEEVGVVEGVVGTDMVRNHPYWRVVVSGLRRLIYVCDEEGNASYVFDLGLMDQNGIGIEQLDNATKDERNTIIRSVPGIGRRLVQTPVWRQDMVDLLTEPIPTPQQAATPQEQGADTSLIPWVSTAELDPWQGFWEDETGKHWAPVRRLSVQLNISKDVLTTILTSDENRSLTTKKVRTPNGRNWDAYCYEEVSILNAIIRLGPENKRVERTGEWGGFYIESEHRHWGSAELLSDKTGLSPDVLEREVLVAELPTIKVINRNLEDVASYCYEDAIELPRIKLHLESPRVEASGPWQGFFIASKQGHWAPIGTIADHLNLNWLTVKRRLPSDMPKRFVKDTTGHIQNAYCWEDVSQLDAIIQAQNDHSVTLE